MYFVKMTPCMHLCGLQHEKYPKIIHTYLVRFFLDQHNYNNHFQIFCSEEMEHVLLLRKWGVTKISFIQYEKCF